MKTKTVGTKVTTTAKACPKTRTMAAGQFKTHCLSVIDEVYNKHEEVIITKHVKPMARIIPENDSPESIFGAMRGLAVITGDLVEPITDPEDWDTDIFPPEDDTETR
jgi:prevent-host-death family protein